MIWIKDHHLRCPLGQDVTEMSEEALWQTGHHMQLLERAAPIYWCQVRKGWGIAPRVVRIPNILKEVGNWIVLCEISWFLKVVYCLKLSEKDSVAK